MPYHRNPKAASLFAASRKLSWTDSVRIKCKDIFKAYESWCGHKQKEEEGFKNPKANRFYRCLEIDLHLPLAESKPGNVKCWSFVPEKMLATVQRIIDGSGSQSQSIDEEKHDALMQQFDI